MKIGTRSFEPDFGCDCPNYDERFGICKLSGKLVFDTMIFTPQEWIEVCPIAKAKMEVNGDGKIVNGN